MSTRSNVVLAFRPAANDLVIPLVPPVMVAPVRPVDPVGADGLKRISDDEHFHRALQSPQPLTYLARRAGMVKVGDEQGMGFLNAETVFMRVLTQPNFTIDADDAAHAHRLGPCFMSALRQVSERAPDVYARLRDATPALPPQPRSFR